MTTATATKTTAEKKTAKKTATNGEVKKTSNYRADGGLTKAHVRILTLLSKKDGKPVSFDKFSVTLNAKFPKTIRWALGTIKSEGRDPFSLMARGYVKQHDGSVDGVSDWMYSITKSGEAALKKATSK